MRKITVGDQVFIQPSREWDWFNPRNIASVNDTTFTTVDGDNIPHGFNSGTEFLHAISGTSRIHG